MTFDTFMVIAGGIMLSAKFLFWLFVLGLIVWAFFKFLGPILTFISYGFATLILFLTLLCFVFFY